jgi:xylose isomerase
MGLVDLRSQTTKRTPDEMLEHLKTFELDLKFSAGIWFFAKGSIRFHDAYGPPLTIAERLDIAASLADYGLAGMEAHYPNEINEENLDLWKQFSRDTGVRLVTVVPNLF